MNRNVRYRAAAAAAVVAALTLSVATGAQQPPQQQRQQIRTAKQMPFPQKPDWAKPDNEIRVRRGPDEDEKKIVIPKEE